MAPGGGSSEKNIGDPVTSAIDQLCLSSWLHWQVPKLFYLQANEAGEGTSLLLRCSSRASVPDPLLISISNRLRKQGKPGQL